MAVQYNKQSTNKDYNDFLKEMGVNSKKQTSMLYKTLKILYGCTRRLGAAGIRRTRAT